MMRIAESCYAFVVLLVTCGMCFFGAYVDGEEPAPGELRQIKFVGEDSEECVIAFRWCPSGVMKEGDPDDPGGMPTEEAEGFWLSETEVSQQQYEIIVGKKAMETFQSYVLDTFSDPAAQEEIRSTLFANSELPVNGIRFRDADSFCAQLSESYDRFKSASGKPAGFSTLKFRCPAHFEWQYACRAGTNKKHFSAWPDDPEKAVVGGFKNFREYLEKENPDIYKEHRELLEAYDGSESAMVRLLDDKKVQKDKALKSYLEGLVRLLQPTQQQLRCVRDEPPNAWNIRGLSGNVAEWVFVVAGPSADRANVPSTGDFMKGDVTVAPAGAYFGEPTVDSLTIWRWQKNNTRTLRSDQANKGRVSANGIRIVVMEAVAESWFADLRQIAGKTYDGSATGDVLRSGVESGMEVAGRDKEGRHTVLGRIGIYGALAKARSGDSKGAGELLRDSVASLSEGGDEFFQQVSAVIQDDDLGKQESAAQQ